jgi:hypothetical protein
MQEACQLKNVYIFQYPEVSIGAIRQRGGPEVGEFCRYREGHASAQVSGNGRTLHL